MTGPSAMKRAARIALLLFVAASLAAPVVRRLRAPAPPAIEVAVGRPNRVTAYYFYGKIRCPTCEKVEAYARETVQNRFAAELADGRLDWQAIDYQRPENEHFAKDYQLVAASLVLVEFRDGVPRRWKNLPEVWQLAENHDAAGRYVEQELRAWLADGRRE